MQVEIRCSQDGMQYCWNSYTRIVPLHLRCPMYSTITYRTALYFVCTFAGKGVAYLRVRRKIGHLRSRAPIRTVHGGCVREKVLSVSSVNFEV